VFVLTQITSVIRQMRLIDREMTALLNKAFTGLDNDMKKRMLK